MKRVEIESFSKSFTLFFISLEILIAVIFYLQYQQKNSQLNDKILNEMKICSHDLKCSDYAIDFQNKKEKILYTLYQDKNLLYSYYAIPNVHKYHLKISYPEAKYEEKVSSLTSSTLDLLRNSKNHYKIAR